MRALRDRGLEAELADARKRIAELQAQLARVPNRDPIARELMSMNAFRAQLEIELKRAQRHGRPLSLAVIDLDHFRELNLRHGFAVGDKVISAVGTIIADQTRAHDLCSRTAGDEFALMLPETGGDSAVEAMQRLLRALEDLEVDAVRGISASVGVAVLRLETGSPEQLSAVASAAMQRARGAGGGQVSLAWGSGDEDGEGAGHGDVVAALASALQERDNYTGEHSQSVVEMARRVSESLGLDRDEVTRTTTAALLHDIGKVGIPDEILHKPGPLTLREWETMRQHPEIGERILRAIPGMGRVAKIIRHEHESWDGSGYPDGIAGEDIPIGARVILACDAYHAMTSDRPYRRAMSHSDALAELGANAGSQFDPKVVETLTGYLYGLRQAGAGIT